MVYMTLRAALPFSNPRLGNGQDRAMARYGCSCATVHPHDRNARENRVGGYSCPSPHRGAEAGARSNRRHGQSQNPIHKGADTKVRCPGASGPSLQPAVAKVGSDTPDHDVEKTVFQTTPCPVRPVSRRLWRLVGQRSSGRVWANIRRPGPHQEPSPTVRNLSEIVVTPPVPTTTDELVFGEAMEATPRRDQEQLP
jgi:hypothetical protein